MPIQINTDEFNEKHKGGYLSWIINQDHRMKWFFDIGVGQTYTATGTYKEACDSVKKYFKTSNQASYGIIKLNKAEEII